MASSASSKRILRIGLGGMLAAAFFVGGYLVGVRQSASETSESIEQQAADDTFYLQTYPIDYLLADSRTRADRMMVFDAVIDRIVATASPGSWMENGQGEGEIQPFPTDNCILISQSVSVHEQAAKVLNEMRREQADNPDQVTKVLNQIRRERADN